MAKGFYFTQGNRGIFYRTDAQRKTDNIARAFIDAIGQINDRIAPETIERAKNDRGTLDDIKRRTDAATLEKIDTGKIIFFKIYGKNFSCAFPVEDFEREVFVF